MQCPGCKIELEDSNFTLLGILAGDDRLSCPDCGHRWKLGERVESKKRTVTALTHRPFACLKEMGN